jgi:broad specificity phosphatase PhoE
MSDTRLLLVRHGHHDPETRYEQHSCSGMTATGFAQVSALADSFAAGATSGPVDVVLASLASRAVQTAEVLAAALGLPVAESTCELCEMHPGEAEGMTFAEAAERFGRTYAEIPGATPYEEWLPGAVITLRRLTERYRGQTVVAATHQAMFNASFVAFGKMPHREAESIHTDNSAVTEWTCQLDDEYRHGIWRLDRHNDTSHLGRPPRRRK